VQRFCKPKVGGSNPSPGTSYGNNLRLSLATEWHAGYHMATSRLENPLARYLTDPHGGGAAYMEFEGRACPPAIVRPRELRNPEVGTSWLSPAENQSRREPENTSPGMENTPPPDHASCIGRDGLGRRVHETAVGRHNHEDRVGPICEQDQGTEEPTPIAGSSTSRTASARC
jgi:hypothetical protein